MSGETCPQYLCLTADAYDEPGFGGAKYVMSPPLRSAHDQAREVIVEGGRFTGRRGAGRFLARDPRG